MALINKHDTNGSKGTLLKGEFGYDDYTAGGDTGRVYVGTGATNIALAKKSEVDLKLNSASYTAADVKTKLLTVDGTGSGIDADLLDGYHGSSAGTANTYALRDGNADITARLFKSTFTEQTTAPATTADICFRNSTTDNYMRFMTSDAFKAWLTNIGVGVATLTDSVSTTSSTIGASATAVKTAYALANSKLGDAAHSFLSTGYQKLSNGLIIQWGQSTGRDWTTVTFPLSFVNACLQVVATPIVTWRRNAVDSVSTTSFTHAQDSGGGSFRWVAIGY